MAEEKRPRARAWLEYAQDLHLDPFFVNRAPRELLAAAAQAQQPNESPAAISRPAAKAASASFTAPRPAASDAANAPPSKAPPPVATASSAAKSAASIFSAAAKASSLFEERIENDSLDRIRTDIGPSCARCKLHKARTNIVFGVGNPKAELVFVGEGPGRDEDEQGEPFVGRAGKLLTQMIEAMGLRRADVYIANVVKCRPPENRLPEKDEITTCSPYLMRQLGVIAPKVICCLGSCSAQTLLQTNQGISRFRGEWIDWNGTKLMATYHPAYLLRNPPAKADVWKDLQKIMAFLGLQPPKRR